MTKTNESILNALRSSLTNLHTLKLGYISKDGVDSERTVTVDKLDEAKGLVTCVAYGRDSNPPVKEGTVFRTFIIENIIFADK